MRLKLLIVITGVVTIVACKKSSDSPNPMANYDSGKGIFVNDEGDYGKGNSGISFINNSNNTVITDVFSTANGRPLGDVAQSMTIYNDRGYIVVNNSQKIEVVTISDFKSVSTITASNNISLKAPRYMLVVDSTKAYISDWTDNNIKVLNLSSLSFEKTISTATGPEQMAVVNGSVYVANTGGYGYDSTITVINASSDQVITQIQVSYVPTSIQVDANNMLWVMCSNYYNTTTSSYNGPGHLVKINPSTNKVVATYAVTGNPERLAVNKEGNKLYYEGTGNGIYKFNITDTVASPNPFIPVTNSAYTVYGVTVDPHNDNIYGAILPSYTAAGVMYAYDSTGKQLNTYNVGFFPDRCLFNY